MGTPRCGSAKAAEAGGFLPFRSVRTSNHPREDLLESPYYETPAKPGDAVISAPSITITDR